MPTRGELNWMLGSSFSAHEQLDEIQFWTTVFYAEEAIERHWRRLRNQPNWRAMWAEVAFRDQRYRDRIKQLENRLSFGSKKRSQSKAQTARYRLWNVKTCAYCDCDLTEQRFDVDHVVPLSKHGSDEYSNMVKACPTCNSMKGVKDWIPLKGAIYADGSIETRSGGGNRNVRQLESVRLTSEQEAS